MSWPIWTIGWLDLDDFTDSEAKREADNFHERSYFHIQQPFLLFSDFAKDNIAEGKILLFKLI